MAEVHEEWLTAPGMLGDYEVSNLGRLRRSTPGKNTHPGRIQALGLHGKYGHLFIVRNGESGKKEKFYIHRLVALAFIGPSPSPEHTQVRHIDGNASNNTVANLAWSTPAENMRDVIEMGRNANANKTHCPRGHEYTPDNTKPSHPERGNGRECRKCRWEDRRRGLPKGDKRHGTLGGYNSYGCRCNACGEAKSSYVKSRKQDR